MTEAYVVGFQIFDGKSLRTEDGNPCDPYVKVECHDQTWYTSTVENRDAFVPWNETNIWPAVEMSSREFETATVEFSIYAKYWFTRDFLIGKTTLQLSFINQRRHHLYARKWLPLQREDTTECTGMLNVSVFALKPGEQAPSASLQEQEAHDDEDGEDPAAADDKLTLTQAQMKLKVEVPLGAAHYVQINVHRVEDLRELVFPGGLPSPYVTVEFASCQLQTSKGDQVKAYAFNETLQIPVRTPLYEDAIILKLWSAGWFTSDILLAQGVISFSELRNKSLPPRWFPLYGWNIEEVPDPSQIASTGGDLDKNFFMGSLLISGLVVPLEEGDQLQPANTHACRTIADPPMMQVALLADVYMVVGAEGRNCRVELSFGSASRSTLEVSCDAESATSRMEEVQKQQDNMAHTVAPSAPAMDLESTTGNLDGATEDDTPFTFSEVAGMIKPVNATVPEEPASQPFVMINVYTDGYFSSFQRVGCAKLRLSDVDQRNPNEAPPPRFHATTPMPNTTSKSAPSVLIAIEWNNTDDVVRFKRAKITPMVYIVRAYCFGARRIMFDDMKQTAREADHYALRIACAGKSKATTLLKGPRPTWMDVVDLKVILFANPGQREPTIEPITATLVQGGSMSLFNKDVGKATCLYTHLRKRDKDMKFEPFRLKPQWIVVSGQNGAKKVGEILVDFELLQYKHRKEVELLPREMWPQPEGTMEDKESHPTKIFFERKSHVCRLKKATLHFSLQGLRDLRPLPPVEGLAGFGAALAADVEKPIVEVEVISFVQPQGDMAEVHENGKSVHERAKGKFVFRYKEVAEVSGLLERQSRMRKWKTKLGAYGSVEGANFEFLQVGRIPCLIPDHPIFEPYITVRVLEEPGSWSMTQEPTLVGESRHSLGHLLPCCWLKGVSMDVPYVDQLEMIEQRMSQARESVAVRDSFQQQTVGEKEKEVKQLKQVDMLNQSMSYTTVLPTRDEEDCQEFVDKKALPEPLRRGISRRPLDLADKSMNMQDEVGFSPRKGDPVVHHHGDNARKTVHGYLEESTSAEFHNDFFFKNIPLLRNHGVIEKDTKEGSLDWNFESGRCYGFVKCNYKLVDGWDQEEEEEEQVGHRWTDGQSTVDPRDVYKLKQSFEFNEHLDSFAFDEEGFPRHFKDDLPSRVRVRIYLVKAVTIFSKSTGFADPYIEYQLGRKHHVQLRNMAQFSTNTPEFYRIEERDIELPEEGRLEVRVMDMQELSLSDTCIGSTVIDLEDRWHSLEWQRHSHSANVPIEVRSLFTEENQGRNRGSIEMWVEMHDVTKHDVPPSFLRKPADTELEIRLVIWTACDVKLVAGEEEYTNVQISTQLDCKEYAGECIYPALQDTDVHYTCKDGQTAVFNWRMVYPNIKMPVTVCNLLVCLYHYEMTGRTFIGSANISLKRFVEKVARDSDAQTIGPNDLKFTNLEAGSEDESVGTVTMTMYVLTQGEASARKVGVAREEPNEDPQLITPTEGRDWGTYLEAFGFEWPDFSGMWKKMLPMVAVAGAFLLALVMLKLIGIF
jgi:hypothetical protein